MKWFMKVHLSVCKGSSQHKLTSNRTLAMISMTLSRISTTSFYIAYVIKCKLSATHVIKKKPIIFPILAKVKYFYNLVSTCSLKYIYLKARTNIYISISTCVLSSIVFIFVSVFCKKTLTIT